MSVRLAVFQHSRRPLEGLCVQLRCSGYEVSEILAVSELLDLAGQQEFDILVVDAEARGIKALLSDIENRPSLCHIPIMLITADEGNVRSYATWSEQIDDIVVLPIDLHDLKGRMRRLSRVVSMTAECQHRREALSDFGAATPMDTSISRRVDGVAALVVGDVTDQLIEVLKRLEGRVTATYAVNSADVAMQLRAVQPELIMATPSIEAADLGAFLDQVKSTSEWTDLPMLFVADTLPSSVLEAVSPLGEAELLSPSAHPAVIRLRIQGLIRQWRLRRQLRGFMMNCHHASVMDGVTGLYAHSFLHHYVDASIADHRTRDSSLVVAACTLVGLSEANKIWGYPAVDGLLRRVALKLAGSCRAQDLVARASGSQFCVLLHDMPACKAAAVCNRLTNVVQTELNQLSMERPHGLNAVVGLAEMTKTDVASTLIRRATRLPQLQGVSQAS